ISLFRDNYTQVSSFATTSYFGKSAPKNNDVSEALREIACDVDKVHNILIESQYKRITIYLENNEDITNFQSCMDKLSLKFNGKPCQAEASPRI
ncbi:MAG: hypothetical protein ACRERU_06495, partial [Methylococcales bacterium]